MYNISRDTLSKSTKPLIVISTIATLLMVAMSIYTHHEFLCIGLGFDIKEYQFRKY